MSRFSFSQVDVFSSVRHLGNPVAVVHSADELDDEQMLAFARWTNLSETTFILAPANAAADYRLRIFTPGGELPFAGHPTLGSCHAWLEAGGQPAEPGMIRQECAAGLIRIRKSEQGLAFAAPPVVRSGPLDAALLEQICTALSLPAAAILDHSWVDNGPGWCAVLLDSAASVLDLAPDFAALGTVCLGVVGACEPDAETDFELRAFVPSLGVPEDPVTGSLNASVAQWLIRSGHAGERYLASQGAAIGRAGRISIEKIDGDVWVAGATVTCIEGSASF